MALPFPCEQNLTPTPSVSADTPSPHPIPRRGLAFAFSESPVPEELEARQRFPNLSFLLVLAEFSCKIPPAERQAA